MATIKQGYVGVGATPSRAHVKTFVAKDYSRAVRKMLEDAPRVASVQSVFRRAINIALDGTLLALLSSELPRMPNGIRVEAHEIEQLVRLLQTGMPLRIGMMQIWIPFYDYKIVLSGAHLWEPRPVFTSEHAESKTITQRADYLAIYLSQKRREGGLAGLIVQTRESRLSEVERAAETAAYLLVNTAKRGERAGIVEATRRLAGLGEGLTPAGDDLLGGFAAVMTLLGGRREIACWIAEEAEQHTTLLSSVLLRHAVLGEVAEQVGRLLLVLASRQSSNEELREAADLLLAYGATSGADTLAGILLGLRTLEGEDGYELHR